MTRCIFHDGVAGSPEWLADVSEHGHTVSYATEDTAFSVTEEQAEAFVARHFDRLPDGTITSDRSAARTADRLQRMAAGYFG